MLLEEINLEDLEITNDWLTVISSHPSSLGGAAADASCVLVPCRTSSSTCLYGSLLSLYRCEACGVV